MRLASGSCPLFQRSGGYRGAAMLNWETDSSHSVALCGYCQSDRNYICVLQATPEIDNLDKKELLPIIAEQQQTDTSLSELTE